MSDATKTTAKPKTAPKTAAATPVTVTGAFAGLAVPEVKRDGKSIYDFGSLAVGSAFGVKGKDKRSMANSVSNANKKYRQEITDPTTGAKSEIATRKFVSFDVDAALAEQIKGTPLEGSDVLVFRTV